MRPDSFQAFKEGMGLLRRMLGALVGKGAPKVEDIVFEPIDGPGAHPLVRAEALVELSRGSVHRVALGDLMARVPAAWKRSGEWAPEQMIDLSAAGRLNAGAERPLAFSLRYLVKLHPSLFRDPGAKEKDSGVDLAMEPLREPEPLVADVPIEILNEAQAELETFTQWDGETQSDSARAKEAKQTRKALSSVKLPATKGTESTDFDEMLQLGIPAGDELHVTAPQAPVVLAQGAPPNSRLKKILEAYAGGIIKTEPAQAPRESAPKLRVLVSETSEPPQKVEGKSTAVASTIASKTLAAPLLSALSNASAVASVAPVAISVEGDLSGPPALQQMRFEELGLSLSRFPEVRGFALWLGEHAMQTGEMGLDTKAVSTRFRMEQILESASLTHGAQDGFLSVTVNHARGGVSVFGGGPCLVAVAHQSEGMPSHLRSWLCGWVSQPLRG